MDDLGQEQLEAVALGGVEDLVGGALLHDLASVHEDHTVCHLSRKAHLVGDHCQGHAFVRQFLHDVEDLADHLGVKRRGRLVEQDDLRALAQRPGDGDTLLLPAGQGRGIVVRLLRQTDAGEQLDGGLLRLLLGHSAGFDRAQRQVLQHGLVGEQVEQLEHEADVGQILGGVLGEVHQLIVDVQLAAVGDLQAVQAADEGGFAGAGGTDDADDFPFMDVQRHVVHGLYVSEMFAQMNGFNHFRPASFPVCARSRRW